ncbi:MAG TPA: ribose-phosphate pyrophosphokinase [Syntrophales bacterium]|nr:ribose-phosphate pyrophosphokinase [Syntrophales bacterium]HPX12313.1 ribose-phosphate pyrophosphokinase [Syntrophales bacterium]HQN76989.1 ribose-phosphate pyrophosphokinase [Syntrophales bacterium]HQQ26400.1 ribose-phosphate pyrophosphokinase [Syntrophales bacterium]
MLERMRIFSGNANLPLAGRICERLGVVLGKANVSTFSDGETRVEIDENVRGMDVFIIQSTCPPVNISIMELLILIDAMKRASADRVTAVIPYYGYARQDRKASPRAPITAKLVADLLTQAGASRVLAMDLHAGQIQGFFNIPVDNLYATSVLVEHIRKNYQDNLVIVSPDTGGVVRARAFAMRLGAALAIIDKRRDAPNESQVMNVIGDVRGKKAIILDDMIDTAGTVVQAAQALLENGAVEVSACCTHPVLSGPAITRIMASNLKEIIATDTIPLRGEAISCERIRILTIAGLLSEAIRRIYYNESVSSLFI